jgi:hypothetical protein
MYTRVIYLAIVSCRGVAQESVPPLLVNSEKIKEKSREETKTKENRRTQNKREEKKQPFFFKKKKLSFIHPSINTIHNPPRSRQNP